MTQTRPFGFMLLLKCFSGAFLVSVHFKAVVFILTQFSSDLSALFVSISARTPWFLQSSKYQLRPAEGAEEQMTEGEVQ